MEKELLEFIDYFEKRKTTKDLFVELSERSKLKELKTSELEFVSSVFKFYHLNKFVSKKQRTTLTTILFNSVKRSLENHDYPRF